MPNQAFTENVNLTRCGNWNTKTCQMLKVYTLLDYFFAIFHGCLTLFNLTGWVWKRTRKIHLVSVSLTILSWFGLGIFYGWGYCPCTEWHWQIKYKLGETDLPYSYVKYYADKLTGYFCDPFVVDVAVVIIGFLAFCLSSWFNWQDHKRYH